MKKLLITLIIILTAFLFLNVVEAANLGDASKMATNVAKGAGYKIANGETAFNQTIGVIINTALSFLGVIFLGLMIYGGFLWMTDRGNENQLKRAQSLITAAVIGIIIVLSAYAISVFVLDKIQTGTLDPAKFETS